MTHLNCHVKSCTYNKDQNCERENITVEGANAHNSSETSCGSFCPINSRCCSK